MNLVQKALAFATKVHEGQFRKDGKTPYIEHPKRVVKSLDYIGIQDQNVLASGYLHDVIEDCNVEREELEKEFNSEIARIVAALTRNADRESYRKRIRDADVKVQIIKLADVVDNCSDINAQVSRRTIRNLLIDCDKLYLSLAQELCPIFHDKLIDFRNRYKHFTPLSSP